MVNLNIILTVIIISIILIILILLTLNYFNKIENFREINGKYGYICSYDSDCAQVENRLCVTEEGYTLYACGYIFGLNNNNVPTEIGTSEKVQITNFNEITIKDIYCGNNYVRILTNDGKVLFSGVDILNTSLEFTQLSFRQLPIGTVKKIFNNAPSVEGTQNVFFYLTYGDILYCCGTNDNGQLGLGDKDYRETVTYVPLSSFNNKKIRYVYIGNGFTFFLTEDNELYASGSNNYGQLGIGNTVSQTLPIKISPASYSSRKIKSVYCGKTWTFILTDQGDVYSTGRSESGSGLEQEWNAHQGRFYEATYVEFVPILVGKNIVSIYTNGEYTFFMPENGRIWRCGKKAEDPSLTPIYTPQQWGSQWPAAEEIKSMYMESNIYRIIKSNGDYLTNYYSSIYNWNYSAVGKNAMGVIYSQDYSPVVIISGNGKLIRIHGELSTCDKRACYYRKVLTEVGDIGENIKQVYSEGGNYAIILTEGGNLYTTGYNASGQLGLGNNDNSSPLTQVTNIVNLSYNVILPLDISFKKISNKVNSSLFLTEEGTVYGCGLNSSGQLGVGDMNDRDGLVIIDKTVNTAETLSNIKQVSAYLNHSMILTEDGNVYASGLNDYGQIGLYGFKSTSGEKNFIQLPISNVIKISCGEDNLYILKNDGYVYACGLNNYGQLGLGHQDNIDEPTKIEYDNDGYSFGNIKDISAKSGSCLFLKTNGDVYACGLNDHGQLCLSDKLDKNVPTKNTRLFSIDKIFMGEMCSFYINIAGTTYSCGRNDYGELGIGNDLGDKITNHTVTRQNIIDISSGSKFTMFLDVNGVVYSCGQGVLNTGKGSRLGFDDSNDIHTPQMINLGGVKMKKIYCGSNHSLFLEQSGVVYGCGQNDEGQLGIGATYSNMAVQIASLSNIKTITCGLQYSFFVNNADTIYGCGLNDEGQLGLGDLTNKNVPTQIESFYLIEYINDVKDVEVGVNECFFLKEDGSVYVSIDKLPLPMSYLTEENIKQISVGTDNFMTDNGSKLFLTKEGNVYSLGLNNNGQLGLGHQNNIEVPTRIEYDNLEKEFGNIKKIICKNTFSMFLTKEGTVYASGEGPIGLDYIVTKPTIIPFISNIKDISASTEHSLFLTEDGYVYGCGQNDKGQLADDQQDIIIPKKLTMVNITAISCGEKHSLFVTKFDEVYSCGVNSYGQLGLGDNTDRQAPSICNISDVKNVYAGDTSSFFFKRKNEDVI